jgi:anti-anti-sigma factor
VALAGELDLATIPRLDQAPRRAASAAGDVVLDLRELDFIDVCGAQFILEADRRIRRGGGRLVVVRGPAELDRLFALTGIDRLIQLVDCPSNYAGPRSSVPAGAGPDLVLLRPDSGGADHRRVSA